GVSPSGTGGGLFDPSTVNPLSKYNFSADSFSGAGLDDVRDDSAGRDENGGGGDGLGMDNLIAGAGLTAGVIALGQALAKSLDSIQQQQAQIEKLAQTTGDAKDAFFELNRAASDMRSDSGSFISTYTNMATATEKLGFSQERTIKATQGLVGALQLGGGNEEAKSAALYQMGQAFSSDRFGGDEFRSFMEAIGTQAPKVAEAFGTDVKGLRAMSEAGKLTAETMFKAFEKMAASNAELLKKQGWTWGQVTTVMANDWQAFLAQATIGGDWQKFTDWAANTLIPIVRAVEKEIAEFWSTLADESKTAILIGILGAVGAAFTALAIPVLAALWPFLAIGAAVWVVYEAFVEWKAWMNGEGGTIFESLFGSFDEFEKRYPSIIKGLKLLSELLGKSGGIAPESSVPSQSQLDDYQKDKPEKGLMQRFLEYNGNFNPMPGVEKFLGLFGSGPAPADVAPKASGAAGSVITNSGNTTTHIHVDSAKAAAETANNLSNPGEITDSVGGNIAESTGAL
ncbi:TPA: tape measure protein, partial [Citrobacter freundii]